MEILFIILFIIGIFLYTKKEMLLIEKNIPMIALTILYIIFLISFSMNLNSTFFLDKLLVYMNGLPLFYGGSLINGTFVTHYLTYFLLFIPIGLMIPFYIYKHYSILTKFVVSTCLCLLLQAVLSISSALVPMLDVNMYKIGRAHV